MNYTEGAVVLTPADIRNIRSYVHRKHRDMPLERRALIIAGAVHRIIHRQLPDFKEAVKLEITRRLVRRTMARKSKTVMASDILSVCLELNLHDDDMKHPLRKWIGQKLGLSLEVSEFQEAWKKMRSLMRQSEEVTAPQLWHALSKQLVPDRRYAPQAASVQGVSVEGAAAPVWPRTRVAGFALLIALLAVSTLLYGMKLFSAPPAAVPKPAGKNTAAVSESGQAAAAETAEPAVSSAPKPAVKTEIKPVPGNELPRYLRYKPIHIAKLKAYLHSRDSMLAEGDAMNAIISAAKRFDINPLLLFAITGQEQGFVPSSSGQAEKIANNPFNVYHSWQDFNTDIEESAAIAAKTVVTLSGRRPGEVDPITWINRKYAEDPNWARGVRSILEMLEEIAGAAGRP